MAQKQKQRPSPLDEPPTASSSDSEEEEQQPTPQQHEEEEEVSEEEASSGEDDEDEDLPPVSKNPPPPPTNPLPQPSSSESDTDSGSGSETESEPDPAPSKVKPLASKPMDQAQKPKALPSPAPPPKSGSKRAAVNNAHPVTDPKRTKKKAPNSSPSAAAAASDDETEEDGKKPGDNSKKSQRLWSEEDELAILKGVVEFTSKTGQDPLKFTNANAFHDFMKKSLHVEVSSNQLKEKLRRLKKKFETNAVKGPKFYKAHDWKSFELSEKVWGSELGGGANGPMEKPKSNGKAVKSPKKETSSRILASAKKPKPETKPELELVRVSMELKESEKMEIDQKPDGGDASSLWRHMSRYIGSAELDEDEVKRGLELIGESNRAELEGKWKKLRLAEIDLAGERSRLIGEQTRLIVEVLRSSNH